MKYKDHKTIFLTILTFFTLSAIFSNYIWIDYHGGSMRNIYENNDKVLCHKSFSSINIREVYAYRNPDNHSHIIIHRVIDKQKDKYITKGDMNDYKDRFLLEEKDFYCKATNLVLDV